jgi:hypothetical protein
MQKIRNRIWRIVPISLAGVVLWGFSRGFIFKKLFPVSEPPDIAAYGDSFFVTQGLFFPIVGIVLILVLGCYVTFFVLIEESLYGNKYIKGLIYGLSFYLIYMIAFFEFYHFFNGSFYHAVLSGLADGTPLFLTGLLLGIFLGTDNKTKALRPLKYLTSIIFIPVFFLIGRVLFYSTIYVSPIINQSASILFIAMYGISIGLSYYFLTQGIRAKKIYRAPFYYALIFLPVSLSGNTLICLKFQFPLLPMVLLTLIDLLAIIIGGLFTESLHTEAASYG